jgi:hypothetical protein
VDIASGLVHVLLANQELGCIFAELSLLQRYVGEAVGWVCAGLHRLDCWDMQLFAVQLGPLDMLVAATDSAVLGNMLLDSFARQDHSSVADSLVEVLLLGTLELGK